MDADKNGTIDQTEWEQHMTPELRAAIEAKLQDSGIVAGFKPLVDIARVSNMFNRVFSLIVIFDLMKWWELKFSSFDIRYLTS